MRQYEIPMNPNRRMPPVTAGLQLGWKRILLLSLAVFAVVVYPKNGQGGISVPKFLVSPAPLRPTAELVTLPAAPIDRAAPDYQAIIARANAAFRVARAQADATALAGVAAGAWLQYEQQYIAELRQQNAAEEWSLTSLAITGTALRGTEVGACTTEEWDRAVRHADGTTIVLAPLNLVEHYKLVRENGRWLVEDIQFTSQGCTP